VSEKIKWYQRKNENKTSIPLASFSQIKEDSVQMNDDVDKVQEGVDVDNNKEGDSQYKVNNTSNTKLPPVDNTENLL